MAIKSLPTLTVVILHRNQINRAVKLINHLHSHQRAWQFLVVDDYSDVGLSILKQLPRTTVVGHHLRRNFAAQRNWALSQITTDWTWFIDADEWPATALIKEVTQQLINPDVNAIFLPRRDWFLGKLLLHGEVGQTQLLRVARTSAGRDCWHRSVHETWQVAGPFITASNYLEHSAPTNLNEFLTKLQFYAALEPAARPPYSWGRLWLEILLYPPAKFLHNYLGRAGWQDGWPGLIHAFFMSLYSLLVRIYIYEQKIAH